MTTATTIRIEQLGPVGERKMTNTAAASAFASPLADNMPVSHGGTIHQLLSKDLAGAPDKEITMITVHYAPGASTPGHTHHAQTMLYVLEGTIVMQLKGSAPVTLSRGETFYEGLNDVHIISRNASETVPAKYVVFLVKDKGAPILTAID
jgi:quercetin dioxygenase-like cupin family protein